MNRIIELAARGVPGISAAWNATTIQAAIDELSGPAGRVVLPPVDVPVDREIFLDRNGISLSGHGKGISRLMATTGRDILTLGVSRRPNVPGLSPDMTPDHFIDLATVPWLKGVVAAPGQRYAFRTKADHHIATQGGPLDTFPAGVAAITIEAAIDLSRLRDPGGDYPRTGWCALFGVTGKGTPSPWEMFIAGDYYYLKCLTSAGKTVQFAFGPIGKTAGFVRLTVQLDLAGRDISAWVDDRRMPVNAKIPDDFAALAPNQHCPFGVGSNCERANHVADYFDGTNDIAFAGLKVTLAPVYARSDSLARLDGRPVTDARYFTLEPKTQGLLWLVDDPKQVAASRCATVLGAGYVMTSAYVLDNKAHDSNFASTAPGPIRDLSLVSPYRYGRGVAVGYALDSRVERCEVFGGRDGVGSLNFGATYPLTILDSELAGADSPLYAYSCYNVRAERTTLPKNFRCGIRLVDSDAVLSHLVSPAWGKSDHYVRSVGSSFAMQDSMWDNEGDGGPQVSPVYCLPGGYPNFIRISRTEFAAYKTPLAILDELLNPDKTPARFVVEDCPDVIRGGLGSGKIDVRGNRWKVSQDW